MEFRKFRKSILRTLPLLSSISLFLFCLIPYFLSILNDESKIWLPMISDSASAIPISQAFFGLFINIFVFFASLTNWYRYKQIKSYLTPKQTDAEANGNSIKRRSNNLVILGDKKLARLILLNKLSLLFSSIGMFGVLMVANFTSKHNQVPHALGAVIVFSGVTLMITISCFIEWILYKDLSVEPKPLMQTVTTFFTLLYFISLALIGLYLLLVEPEFMDFQFRNKTPDDHPNYLVMNIFAIIEWLFVFNISVYYLCIFPKFKIV